MPPDLCPLLPQALPHCRGAGAGRAGGRFQKGGLGSPPAVTKLLRVSREGYFSERGGKPGRRGSGPFRKFLFFLSHRVRGLQSHCRPCADSACNLGEIHSNCVLAGEGETDRQTDTAAGRWAADLILAHGPSPCAGPSHLWPHWTSHPPQIHGRPQPCLFTAPPLPGWPLRHPAGKVFVTFRALAPQSPWVLLAQDVLLEASCPRVLLPLTLAGVQTRTVAVRSAWGASPAERSSSAPHAPSERPFCTLHAQSQAHPAGESGAQGRGARGTLTPFFPSLPAGVYKGHCFRINHFPEDNDYDHDSSEYLLRECRRPPASSVGAAGAGGGEADGPCGGGGGRSLGAPLPPFLIPNC